MLPGSKGAGMFHSNDFQIVRTAASTTRPSPTGRFVFIGVVSALNVLMIAILLSRGFDFWANNPGGVDALTAAACAVVAALTVTWAVIYAKQI